MPHGAPSGGYGYKTSSTSADGLKPEFNEVVFHVVEARGLVAADASGFLGMGKAKTSDPFCYVKDVKGLVGSTQKTKVVYKTLNPQWNQEFRYRFNHKLSCFKFVVFDYDQLTEPDALGKLVLGLPEFYDLPRNGDGWRVLEGWFPLASGKGAKWHWLKGKSRGQLGELRLRVSVRFNIPLCLPGYPMPLGGKTPIIQVALGWDFGKKTQPVDLDASIIGFDERFNAVDTVWFRKLQGFNGAVRHSGDDRTGEGGGDDETITVDMSRLPPNCKYMCVVVNSFTGQSLAKVKHAYIRVIENGRTSGIMTMYRNEVRSVGRVVDANPYAMKDCTGLFFGMLHQGNFVCVNQEVNGKTAQESAPAIVRTLQNFLAAGAPPAARQLPAAQRPSTGGYGAAERGAERGAAGHDLLRAAMVGGMRLAQAVQAATTQTPSTHTAAPPPPPTAPPPVAVARGVPDATATSSGAGYQSAVSTWDVDMVCAYLQSLELTDAVGIFRTNAVDGQMLKSLTEADLVSELKLTKLQARKVMQRLPA